MNSEGKAPICLLYELGSHLSKNAASASDGDAEPDALPLFRGRLCCFLLMTKAYRDLGYKSTVLCLILPNEIFRAVIWKALSGANFFALKFTDPTDWQTVIL